MQYQTYYSIHIWKKATGNYKEIQPKKLEKNVQSWAKRQEGKKTKFCLNFLL